MELVLVWDGDLEIGAETWHGDAFHSPFVVWAWGIVRMRSAQPLLRLRRGRGLFPIISNLLPVPSCVVHTFIIIERPTMRKRTINTCPSRRRRAIAVFLALTVAGGWNGGDGNNDNNDKCIYASAFELSSLLGGSSSFGEGEEDYYECRNNGPASAAGSSCDDSGTGTGAGTFAYPRRNLIDEFGQEGYQQRLSGALALGGDASSSHVPPTSSLSFGVDVSFPTHSRSLSPESTEVFGNIRLQEYNHFVGGCTTFYEKSKPQSCEESEEERVQSNLQQPMTMQNYTDIGFQKMKVPQRTMDLLTDFWNQNEKLQAVEKWPIGNTHVNHWQQPTYMMSVENPSLTGGGPSLKQQIWDTTREALQQWTGQDLSPSSLYGIRVYKEGAILPPHVDRLPLVTSAIINVAQDVDEPWPIELLAHDGKAYNITLEPGEMILYESHSVIHGRPYPLNGQFQANVFVHFEPVGHSVRHESRMRPRMSDGDLFEASLNAAADNTIHDLPPYIMRATAEEERWRQQHKKREPAEESSTTKKSKTASHKKGVVTIAHTAAGDGDLDVIRKIAASEDTGMFHVKDPNGWLPLHEAARGGFVEIIEILLEHDVDVNARPNNGLGGTALWWSDNTHGVNSAVSQLLRKKGAKSIAPSSRNSSDDDEEKDGGAK